MHVERVTGRSPNNFLTPKRYQVLIFTPSHTFWLTSLKGTTILLTEVILDFNTLRGTKKRILTPKDTTGVPPPGVPNRRFIILRAVSLLLENPRERRQKNLSKMIRGGSRECSSPGARITPGVVPHARDPPRSIKNHRSLTLTLPDGAYALKGVTTLLLFSEGTKNVSWGAEREISRPDPSYKTTTPGFVGRESMMMYFFSVEFVKPYSFHFFCMCFASSMFS